MPNAYSGRVEAPVSPFVHSQFPSFYADEGPQFIEFVKSYYEWKETLGPLYKSRRLLDYVDVDATEEEYLLKFVDKYLTGTRVSGAADARFLVKHVKDVYRSKGSLEGLRLFFRLLYSRDSDCYVPSVDVLAASDGVWKKPLYLEVSESSLNESYRQRRVYGYNSGATAIVEDYVEFYSRGRPARVMYISNLKGDFQVGEKVYADSADLQGAPFIRGSVTALSVTSGPSNSLLGDKFYHEPGRLVVRASTVDSLGTGTLGFTLVDGGYGYTFDATIDVLAGGVLTESGDFLATESGAFIDAVHRGSGGSFYVASIGDTESIQVPITLLQPYDSDALDTAAASAFLPVVTESLHTVVTEDDLVLLAETSGSTVFESLLMQDWEDARAVTVGIISSIVTTAPGSDYDTDATVVLTDPLVAPEALSDGLGGIMGLDALVLGDAASGGDTVADVTVVSSGFSYFDDEQVTSTFYGNEHVLAEDVSELHTEDGYRIAWGRADDIVTVGSVTLGAVGTSEGRWSGDSGMLNSRKRVQDSYYYQEFSYDVRTNMSLNSYEGALREVYHPAGVELFGTTVAETSGPSSVTGEADVAFEGYDYTVFDLLETAQDGAAYRFLDQRAVTKSSSNTLNDYDGVVEGRVTVQRSTPKMVWRSGVLTSIVADTLPYDEHPVTGEPLGLLLEGAATNALVNTYALTDASWHTTRTAVSSGYPAPDGTNTAFLVTETVTNGRHAFGKQNYSVTADATFTFSSYVKLPDDGRLVYPLLQVTNSNSTSTERCGVVFDVVAGEHQDGAVNTAGGGYSPTVHGAGMEECSDGWWRLWVTASIGGGDSTLGFYVSWENDYVDSSIGPSFTGDGTSGLYVWCPMVEEGKTRPSSPVQSGSSPGTRGADYVTVQASTFFPVGAQYTLAASYSLPVASGSTERVAASLDSGTDAEESSVLASSASGTGFRGRSSSATQFNLFDVPDSSVDGQAYRTALSVAVNSVRGAADGTLSAEDSAAAVPAVTTLRLGHDSDGNHLDGHLRSFLLLCGVAETDAWVQEVSDLDS